LQPKTFDQIKDAVGDGPLIIVNIHRIRCNALILKPGQSSVHHVPLIDCSVDVISTLRTKLQSLLKLAGCNARKTQLDRESGDPHQQNNRVIFQAILRDLWSVVVRPVLEVLDLFVGAFIILQILAIPNLNVLANGSTAFTTSAYYVVSNWTVDIFTPSCGRNLRI
jgi:hypothetical protein